MPHPSTRWEEAAGRISHPHLGIPPSNRKGKIVRHCDTALAAIATCCNTSIFKNLTCNKLYTRQRSNKTLRPLVEFGRCVCVCVYTHTHTHIYIYIYIYTLTPWSRVLFEKLTGLQLVRKLPAFYGTRRFITYIYSIVFFFVEYFPEDGR